MNESESKIDRKVDQKTSRIGIWGAKAPKSAILGVLWGNFPKWRIRVQISQPKHPFPQISQL